MTLVIAEISRFGIVMAADTAETNNVTATSGRKYTRIKYGVQKLFPIEYLTGGVSYWGAGEIYAGGTSGRIPTDVWLEDFIDKERLKSLEEFAYTLRKWINILHGPERPLLGFQVAGIGPSDAGDNQPIFYRVCNHDKDGGRRLEFEVEAVDIFPHIGDQPMIFADGDETLYFDVQKRIEAGPLQSRNGHAVPRAGLSGRDQYQAALVRFVSDLYESAGLVRTIGGKVTILSVPFAGAVKFEES